MTATTTAEPKRRRSHWMGPRRELKTRVRPDLADRLERDALAAGRSVSEHLAYLLARSFPEEAAAPTP